jgi:pyruvate dehydrogenase E2 component (dihydrolipoamide acetyltransferase)
MNVLMPQLGETVAEGKITQWFKSAGEPINFGDNLFEIETDKVSMEVPSTTAGVLSEIRVPAGEVAPVGAVVAVISEQKEGASSAPAQPKSASPKPPASTSPAAPAQSPLLARLAGGASFAAAQPAATIAKPLELDPFFEVRTPARNYGPARLATGVAVSPLARRLAAETGIELAGLEGSGAHGRIRARDIESARARTSRAIPGAPPAAGYDQIKSIYRNIPFEEITIDGMRRTIARRLVSAKQTIPHFYLTADVEIAALLALREQANAAAPRSANGQPQFKLSINDLIVKAWASAMHRTPMANAVWAEERILRFARCDIGFAISIPGGLIAPIIRQAEQKTVSTIANEIRELAVRARARKLVPQDYEGGSSTVSNLGMYGVREFSAIINPPQSTILAIGAARRQPVESATGGVAFASVLSVTLACDHRVVDGAMGAELLAAFKNVVEHPVAMLV